MKTFYNNPVALLSAIVLAQTVTTASAQEKPKDEPPIEAVVLGILVTAGLAGHGDHYIGNDHDAGPINMDLCEDGRVGSDGSCVTPVGGNVDIDAGTGSGGLGLTPGVSSGGFIIGVVGAVNSGVSTLGR